MPTVEMNVLVPAVAALFGALIGSIAPIIVGIVQARSEMRQERMRLSTQLGIEDHKTMQELRAIRIANGKSDGGVAPLSSFVAYHADILDFIAQGKSLTPEQFVEHRKKASEIFSALNEYQRK